MQLLLCLQINQLNLLCRLLCPSSPRPILLKALGLLVNLTQDSESSTLGEELIVQQGTELLVTMETLLEEDSPHIVTEQCLCVLVNLSSSTSEKVRDFLVRRETVTRCICSFLVSH